MYYLNSDSGALFTKIIKSKSGFFAPLNAREKRQKNPYLTIDSTMRLLHTLSKTTTMIPICITNESTKLV